MSLYPANSLDPSESYCPLVETACHLEIICNLNRPSPHVRGEGRHLQQLSSIHYSSVRIVGIWLYLKALGGWVKTFGYERHLAKYIVSFRIGFLIITEDGSTISFKQKLK